jgi:hypothetical protein
MREARGVGSRSGWESRWSGARGEVRGCSGSPSTRLVEEMAILHMSRSIFEVESQDLVLFPCQHRMVRHVKLSSIGVQDGSGLLVRNPREAKKIKHHWQHGRYALFDVTVPGSVRVAKLTFS